MSYPLDDTSYGRGNANTHHQAPHTQFVVPQKKRMSKGWPLSFFILAIVFAIVGGSLVGAWASSYSAYTTTHGRDRDQGGSGNDGLLYGSVACFIIAGLFKIVAWILLLVWCIKRSRAKRGDVVVYVQQQTVADG